MEDMFRQELEIGIQVLFAHKLEEKHCLIKLEKEKDEEKVV